MITQEMLIQDLKFQLSFISSEQFDFEHFRDTLSELEEMVKIESEIDNT
jgi:hypothetical protein